MISARRIRTVHAVCVTAAMLAMAGLPAAQEAPQPDFSGIWMPAGSSQTPRNPQLTEDADRKRQAYEASFETDDDPGRYCISGGMPRAIWGAPFAIEIFHRPQDLTIYFEAYSQYRKIYMAGHPRPEPLMHTRMGYSVGRWEGEVLVIETTHLVEYPYMTRLATSADAHVLERMYIEEREVNGQTTRFLVDEITLTDPKVYTEPVHITASARWSPDAYVLEYSCSDMLWEQHLDRKGLTLPTWD